MGQPVDRGSPDGGGGWEDGALTKAVLLLHCDAAGERFVVAGVRVLRTGESEATALWPLLDTFLATVGSGVMKVLLVDRGFINGAEIGRLKRDHSIDTVIPTLLACTRAMCTPTVTRTAGWW
jgi:hypothetical protein